METAQICDKSHKKATFFGFFGFSPAIRRHGRHKNRQRKESPRMPAQQTYGRGGYGPLRQNRGQCDDCMDLPKNARHGRILWYVPISSSSVPRHFWRANEIHNRYIMQLSSMNPMGNAWLTIPCEPGLMQPLSAICCARKVATKSFDKTHLT